MPYPGRTPTNPPVLPANPAASAGSVLASSGMGMSASAAQAYAVTVLDRHESELVQSALEAVASRSPADATILQGLLSELRATAELLDRQRPLRRPTSLGGEGRDESTLIDHLCTIDGLSGDLVLPLKSTLSRTHLLAKIN